MEHDDINDDDNDDDEKDAIEIIDEIGEAAILPILILLQL